MKLLPPALNTAPFPLAQGATIDGPEIQAWAQGHAQEEALTQNNVLKRIYRETTFSSWYVNYAAGRINGGDPDAPPPHPPNGLMVQVADDGITCDLVPLGPPVCPVPEYTRLPKPQTQEQAAHAFDKLTAGSSPSPFNSNVPLFTQPVTAGDGSKWVRIS